MIYGQKAIPTIRMQSLKSSTDDTYRNLWNECISEEFMDNDCLGNKLDIISPGFCQAYGRTSTTTNDTRPHKSYVQHSDPRLGFRGPTCTSYGSNRVSRTYPVFSVLRFKIEESASPTITVAELQSAPGSADSQDSSSCLSPASYDNSLLNTLCTHTKNSGSSSGEEEAGDSSLGSDYTDTASDEDFYPAYNPKRATPPISKKKPSAPILFSRLSSPRLGGHRLPRKARKEPSTLIRSNSQRGKPRARQVDASVPFMVPEDFRCLHCDFVQGNQRLQDFKRHVANHFRSTIYWDCRGVPLAEVSKYRASQRGKILERDGIVFVGGCGSDFGRKDAYKRHLDDPNNGCIGDIDADWHPGNAYKDFD